MTLRSIFIVFCLFLISSCNNSDLDSQPLTENPVNAYSVSNSYNWTEINSASSSLEGTCAIVGGNIVYTKTNPDFNGYDQCNNDNDTGAPGGCSRSYYIDFGDPTPQLKAGTACQ